MLKLLKGLSAERLAELGEASVPPAPGPSEVRATASGELGGSPGEGPEGGGGALGNGVAEGAAPPPFDLLRKLGRDKWLQATAASKWQERKAACEQLIALLHDSKGSPRAAVQPLPPPNTPPLPPALFRCR